MLDVRDQRAFHVADAARMVAGELPYGFGRGRCFRLRAGSLELWGVTLRVKGEPVMAEAALLSAFELLAQTHDAEPADLAAILGRLALVAGDGDRYGERQEDLERYAGEAVRVVRASDRDWPLPAFVHLWRAVSADLESLDSCTRVSKAVFDAMMQAYDGFHDQLLELSLEMVEGRGAEVKIEGDRLLVVPRGKAGETEE